MGSGTLGVAARQTRAEREAGRERSWEQGLQGKETTAQGGERAAGERRRIAMGESGGARRFFLLCVWVFFGVYHKQKRIGLEI